MTTATYIVSGMTCGHCASSVKQEVSAVAGVSGVDVDLASGRLTVHSQVPVSPAAVSRAVEEAGYQLQSQPTASEAQPGGCCSTAAVGRNLMAASSCGCGGTKGH